MTCVYGYSFCPRRLTVWEEGRRVVWTDIRPVQDGSSERRKTLPVHMPVRPDQRAIIVRGEGDVVCASTFVLPNATFDIFVLLKAIVWREGGRPDRPAFSSFKPMRVKRPS